MSNIINCYVDMWKNFANFSGRTSVGGYWWACLANFIVSFVIGLTGVEILDGDNVFFRGGYIENGGSKENLVLIDENGDMTGLTVSIVFADGNSYDSSGNIFERGGPSATTVLYLWLEPELVSKANWAFWFGGILVSILTVVCMVFADDLFRLKFAFQIQNIEQVEPSELEIAGRYFGWMALTVLVFVINMTGLQ